MKITLKIKIGAVELIVSDIEKSLKWYKEKLGAQVVKYYKKWRCVDFNIGKSKLLIDMGEPNTSWGSEELKRAKERIGKSTGIIFETNNVNKTYKILKERGVKFIQPPTKTNWGETIATFIDIDGNEFKISKSSK